MKNLSIIGFWINLVALILSVFPMLFNYWASILAFPIAIIGLCLSAFAVRMYKDARKKSALATIGMIIGLVATVYSSITFATCGLCKIFFDI